MSRYKKESDLAVDVIAFLERSGWTEIFQEVYIGGSPIDIVATKTLHNQKQVLAVECKLSLSWHLLAQARRQRESATFVCIAVPHMKMDWEDAELIKDVLKWLNIGLLRIDGKFVIEDKADQNYEANTAAILDALRPEHKTHAKAGTNRGYWTEWKTVAEAVALYVRENPGCALKDLLELDAVKKYYPKPAQAKRNIQRNLENKIIKHVELRDENGKKFCYPFHPS